MTNDLKKKDNSFHTPDFYCYHVSSKKKIDYCYKHTLAWEGGRWRGREGKRKGGSEGVRHRAGLSWNRLYFVAWCISDCSAARINQGSS